jgi:UDP-glucose 4-epimerase
VRVLVTGATGFVGGSIIRALVRKGHDAIAAVRRHDVGVRDCESVVWDIGQARRPSPLPPKIDAIVHAAQSRNYRAFPADADEMLRVNVAGACALLDYAVDAGVSRFCLLSSGTVYEPYGGGLHEEAALSPTSFLGATKLAAEVLARPYASDVALSILRLFFPYGPGQRDRLIPDIVDRVRSGRAVQLSADGDGLRIVPTYVEDIAEVTVAAVVEGWSGTMNVAAPWATTLRELAELIGTNVGRRPIFETTDRAAICITPVLDRLRAHFDMSRFTPIETALVRMLTDRTNA